MSKGLAGWAPGLVQQLQKAVIRITEEEKWVKALSAKDKKAVDDWKKHCQANHLSRLRHLQFGGEVLCRKKTWFNRGVDWEFPMSKARCLGPEGDMSLRSGGYVLEVEDGQWIKSTVVVKPGNWEQLQEEGQQQAGDGKTGTGEAVDDQDTLEEIRPTFQVRPHDAPRRRLHGKTPPTHGTWQQPSLSKLQDGGECEVPGQETEHEDGWEERMRLWFRSKEQNANMMEGKCSPGEIYGMMKIAEEVKILEDRLSGDSEARLRKLEKQVEEEVLQTRVVELEEVQMDLLGWKEAFEKEGPCIEDLKR